MKVRVRMRLPATFRVRGSAERSRELAGLKHAYQGLIHSLILPEAEGSKTILVTSTRPREGVSYVSTSLAVELAEHFRQPVLVAEAGALLARNPEQVHSRCVLSRFDNVWILPNGIERRAPNGVEAIVRACFEVLEKRYAYIIIDCPALTTSSKAQVLAASVDGIILVAESGRTSRQDLRRGAARLRSAGGLLWGCVLNRCRHPSFDVLPLQNGRSISRGAPVRRDNQGPHDESVAGDERRPAESKESQSGETAGSAPTDTAGSLPREHATVQPVQHCLRQLSEAIHD